MSRCRRFLTVLASAAGWNSNDGTIEDCAVVPCGRISMPSSSTSVTTQPRTPHQNVASSWGSAQSTTISVMRAVMWCPSGSAHGVEDEPQVVHRGERVDDRKPGAGPARVPGGGDEGDLVLEQLGRPRLVVGGRPSQSFEHEDRQVWLDQQLYV